MSGDAAGVLIGGSVLIGVLPTILAITATYLAARTAVSVGKAAAKAAKDHHQKHQLEVNNCSAELSDLYKKLNTAVDTQDKLGDAYYERVENELGALAQSTEQALRDMGDTNIEAAEQLLREVHEQTAQALGEQRRQELARIRTETERETNAIVGELRHAQEARVAAADWAQSTAAAQAQQRALAQDLLRDAAASLKLLRAIAQSDGDPVFAAKVEAIGRTYDTACRSLEAGLLQTVATSAQQVITRSATLALQHEQERSERNQAFAALQALLEGLRAEMAGHEWVEFEDESFGHCEEHLDDFTQGAFSAVLGKIDERLQWLNSDEAARLSAEQLDLEFDRIEAELHPEAERTLATGRAMLQKFYERLHALHVLEEYMTAQGYTCDWQQMAGGDATQRAVGHFVDKTTGNSIVVSLDDEDRAMTDLDRMAMEVMFHYGNGHPVSEDEKEQVRAGMIEALRAEHVDGGLSCTGRVGQESADETMLTAELVEHLPVQPLS